MGGDNIKSDPCLRIPSHKEILRKFDFAQPFLDDPAIFSPNSVSSRNFLIQAFAYIHPHFHYLSFLNEDVDQEIIKAAELLQILPMKSKKSEKWFDNLNDSEITKFWNRLFVLLKCKDDVCFDTVSSSEETKFDFFKNISKTFDYVNYKLPVVKGKTFSSEALNKEIETWSAIEVKSKVQNESSVLNFADHQKEDINIEKIIIDLKQVTSMLENAQFPSTIHKHEHLEFFNTFISLTESISQYVINLKEIDSVILDELHHNMVTEGKLLHSSCLYFLKKCSNYFKTLEFRNKFSV